MSKFSIAIESVSHSAAVKASQPLSTVLKDMAREAGWPEEVVNHLSVVTKDGNLTPYYPGHVEKTVNDLEYGTEIEPPKMVLRKFNYNLSDLMQPYIAKELESRMSEVVGAL